MNLATARRPRHHWQCFDTVVDELRRYVSARPDIQQRNRLPTHRRAAAAVLLCVAHT